LRWRRRRRRRRRGRRAWGAPGASSVPAKSKHPFGWGYRIRDSVEGIATGETAATPERTASIRLLATRVRARPSFVPYSRCLSGDFASTGSRCECAAPIRRTRFSRSPAVLQAAPNEPGVLVEAGCFKGGSTAKLSLLAELAGRELVVFDSFEGLPDNDESGQVTIQ